MTEPAYGFDPIGSTEPVILVLGSLPSEASIAQNQYYAHPRNQFWRIMQALFWPELPQPNYAERVALLSDNRLMVWDVLQSAHRTGSLDSNIRSDGMRPNDFSRVVRGSDLSLIAFNGTAAEKLFLKRVVPSLGPAQPMLRMPSTSPAHASLSFEQKLEKWRILLNYV